MAFGWVIGTKSFAPDCTLLVMEMQNRGLLHVAPGRTICVVTPTTHRKPERRKPH